MTLIATVVAPEFMLIVADKRGTVDGAKLGNVPVKVRYDNVEKVAFSKDGQKAIGVSGNLGFHKGWVRDALDLDVPACEERIAQLMTANDEACVYAYEDAQGFAALAYRGGIPVHLRSVPKDVHIIAIGSGGFDLQRIGNREHPLELQELSLCYRVADAAKARLRLADWFNEVSAIDEQVSPDTYAWIKTRGVGWSRFAPLRQFAS